MGRKVFFGLEYSVWVWNTWGSHSPSGFRRLWRNDDFERESEESCPFHPDGQLPRRGESKGAEEVPTREESILDAFVSPRALPLSIRHSVMAFLVRQEWYTSTSINIWLPKVRTFRSRQTSVKAWTFCKSLLPAPSGSSWPTWSEIVLLPYAVTLGVRSDDGVLLNGKRWCVVFCICWKSCQENALNGHSFSERLTTWTKRISRFS